MKIVVIIFKRTDIMTASIMSFVHDPTSVNISVSEILVLTVLEGDPVGYLTLFLNIYEAF